MQPIKQHNFVLRSRTYMAGEHVPEEVVGGAGEGRLGEDAAGALELRGERVYPDQPRHVLGDDDEEQVVLGLQHGGLVGVHEEPPDDHLRQRQDGQDVGHETAPDRKSVV